MRRTFSRCALLAAALWISVATPAAAQTTELFFSEYIEGTSNNKALEIYNGTGAAVNLATGGYNVQMYFNGSATAGLTVNLTGTVAAGDVYVLAQSAAISDILARADQTNGSGWFNGDDVVVLRKGTTVLDVIGQIGFDPGTEWGTEAHGLHLEQGESGHPAVRREGPHPLEFGYRILVSKRALLCFAVLITVGAGREPPAGRTATAYRQLVDDYRHRSGASVQRASALVETEIPSFVDAVLNAGDDSPPWTGEELRAAAMLHTDACLWLLKSGRADAAFVHLNAARRLVEATVRDRSSQPFASLWYRNVSEILIKVGAPAWGSELTRQSQPVLAHSEGEAAFFRGLDMEIMACEVNAGVSVDGFGMRLSTPSSI